MSCHGYKVPSICCGGFCCSLEYSCCAVNCTTVLLIFTHQHAGIQAGGFRQRWCRQISIGMKWHTNTCSRRLLYVYSFNQPLFASWTSSPKRNLGANWNAFLEANCPSCCPANSVAALNGSQSAVSSHGKSSFLNSLSHGGGNAAAFICTVCHQYLYWYEITIAFDNKYCIILQLHT